MSTETDRQRNYQLDNIRAILIYLVVLGHLIPTTGAGYRGNLYNFIYTFHMAVFVFTSGYYARFDRKKILKHYLWPYIFFQTAYYYFNVFALKTEAFFGFTTPYYTLWYLLTVATYYCCIPLFQTRNRKHEIIAIALSFLAALLIGLDDTVGAYLSLSRTVTFLPFFLLGLYRQVLIDGPTAEKLKNRWILIVAIVAIIGLEVAIWFTDVHPSALRFDNEYADISVLPIRFIAELLGLLWTFALFRLVPTKRIKIISIVGQNTMPVYLLHGFIARLVTHYHILRFEPAINELLAVIMAIIIVLLFGNGALGKLFKEVF